MQDIKTHTCDAVESDWLDITYTERKYINSENEIKTGKKPTAAVFFKRNAKYLIAVVLLIAAVAGMTFATTENSIFQVARTAYTSSLMSDLKLFGASQKRIVTLPANSAVSNVSPNGTVTLGGGKVATCLEEGTVTSVTATTVTVKVDEEISMVYSMLTDVMVQEGQKLEKYQCLGRYDGQTTVNVVYNGEVVTDVIGSDYSFTWEG